MKRFVPPLTVLALCACVSPDRRQPDWPYPEPPDAYPGEVMPGVPDPRAGRVQEPPQPPRAYPESHAEDSGPAVVSLIDEADAALDRGEPDQAAAMLERAQRIEPRNPWVWQRLARTRLSQQRPAQAETMAAQSNSLARGNPWVTAENWRLIAIAREQQGDREGAREARENSNRLQQTLPRS